MSQPSFLKNLPVALRSLWRPMLLISVGMHGFLLAMPIPSPKTSSNSQEKQKELVSLIQLKPSPLPSPSASTPIPPKAKIAAAPRPTPQLPRPTTPVATPILPSPVPLAIAQLDTKPKEAPAPPQQTPSPTPSPIPDVAVQESPIPNPPELGTSEIEGVPVDSTWQAVAQPAEVLLEANMFIQPNGQLHPDIVGKVAQVPGKNPDQVFEEFFSSKLESANFQVEPFGTYVPGGGLYKLTRDQQSPPLYLALAPTKDGTGTVVTIWNNFPSPIE